MKYPYFRGLEADRYSFYRVPKALIKVDLFEKMSGDAKLLYAVLLDRMNLSLKNGWQDENGNAYIICTIDEIMDSIRCARQKAVKLLDELEHEYQLIERRRQGLGKPNLLYVKDLYSARSIKMKENSILFRIQEAEERRLRLYEDYKAEILDEDEYSQLKEHYIAEKQRLEHELQKQRQRALELEKRIKICDAQMERMRGILNQNEFDEELVHELIKRIYVGMDNSVEVEFKCSDPYQEVLAIMSEVQNE